MKNEYRWEATMSPKRFAKVQAICRADHYRCSKDPCNYTNCPLVYDFRKIKNKEDK